MNQTYQKIITAFTIVLFGFLIILNIDLLITDDWKPKYFVNRSIAKSIKNSKSSPEQNNDNMPINVDNRSIVSSEQLFKEVRVICWVMTQPKNHKTKAIAVKKTWGSRCNKLIFISSKNDSELNPIILPLEETRNNLWAKTKAAFTYVYKNFFNDGDWFMKADDDTYVLVENLRYMLYAHSPETPIYFGFKFKQFVKQGYMSGGAGYVLSREALKRFVEIAIPDGKKCKQDNGFAAEDVEIGKCLENVEVIAGDSRDSKKRNTFYPFALHDFITPGILSGLEWFHRYVYYEQQTGRNCCSNYTISFHYVQENIMYVMDYFIYHLRVYGMSRKFDPLPKRISAQEDINNWRNDLESRRTSTSTENSSTKT